MMTNIPLSAPDGIERAYETQVSCSPRTIIGLLSDLTPKLTFLVLSMSGLILPRAASFAGQIQGIVLPSATLFCAPEGQESLTTHWIPILFVHT